MTVRMICTDLDGTLLRSDKTVSRYSLEVLKKASEKGILIVPVTGRHLGGIPNEILEQGVRYVIFSNGAGLYDLTAGKMLKEECIPENIMDELIPLFPELDVMSDLFTAENAYTDSRCLDVLNDVDASDAVKAYIRSSRVLTDSTTEFYTERRPNVEKITVNFRKINGEFKNRDILLSILKKYDEELVYVTGGANNIEITSKKATKGNCITALSEVTGIPLSETAALGDTENDLSILETVGISTAMSNADENVKKLCRFITDSDNDSDGAAKFIEKMFL
ncbi:MAG: Cof-type HAD-IIB family hydrolase [Oscillospiraceae bacterium]|nr:Cof-type HAD-IIB family hydrolase [Oscillospiraceae bacterium]